jgi:hypothetical protein
MNRKLTRAVGDDLNRIKTLMDMHYGFDIFSRSRKRPIVDARRVFTALIYEKYDLRNEKLNKFTRKLTLKMLTQFMKFDHAQIIHLKNTFDILAHEGSDLKRDYNTFLPMLAGELEDRVNKLCLERKILTTRIVEIDYELTQLINEEEEDIIEGYYIPSE